MKKIFKRIYKGFLSFFWGFSYLLKNRLLHYIIVPSIVSMFTITLIVIGFYYVSDFVFSYTANTINSFSWIQSVNTYLETDSGFLHGLIKFSRILLELTLAFFLTLLSYRVFIPVVLLPFLSPLLSRIEKIELGSAITTTYKEDFNNILRASYIALRSGIIALVLLVLGLCLGPFEIIINVIYQGHSLGRSSFDTVFEKEFPLIKSRDQMSRKWRWEISGHGLAYLLFLFIPLIGVIFAPIISLVGACVLYYQKDHNKV